MRDLPLTEIGDRLGEGELAPRRLGEERVELVVVSALAPEGVLPLFQASYQLMDGARKMALFISPQPLAHLTTAQKGTQLQRIMTRSRASFAGLPASSSPVGIQSSPPGRAAHPAHDCSRRQLAIHSRRRVDSCNLRKVHVNGERTVCPDSNTMGYNSS